MSTYLQLADEVNHDLLAITRFRNLRLHQLVGAQTQTEVARQIGVNVRTFNGLLNLKLSPISRKGEYRQVAARIATYFGYTPEELFPETLYALRLPKTVFRTFPSEKLVALSEAKEIRYLPQEIQDEDHDHKILREKIAALVASLRHPKQQLVVELFYGLNDQQPLTTNEIAARLKISRARVHQILNSVIRRLRHPKRIERLKAWNRGDHEQ